MSDKNTAFSQNTTLNCNGQMVTLSSPAVMGILNVTPDSFYDGGKFTDEKSVLLQVEKMATEGATFIDVGGMSTRPGAKTVGEEEELKRVIPVIRLIASKFPELIISIDTVYAKVAREAVDAGAGMVNDISGGSMDEKMFETIAGLNVPYVLMHIQGTPETMQQSPRYEDCTLEVTDYFIKKIATLHQLKIKDIILDHGFGFGKTNEHNFELLNHFDNFKIFGLPLLAGLSRKSMICKTLGVSPPEALNGTTVLNTIALQKGANILRVHDVKEATEAIKLVSKLAN